MSSRVTFYNVLVSCVTAILVLIADGARAQPTATSRPSATQPAATQPARKRSNAEVRNGLDRQLPKVRFQASLSDAIDFMRDVTGLPIDVRWDQLKAVGINEKSPVTVNLPQTKMRDILTAILTSAAGKPGVVEYAIAGGAIVIGPTHPPATQPK